MWIRKSWSLSVLEENKMEQEIWLRLTNMSQKQTHNQRTSVLHKNITIAGSLAQPFDPHKISKLSIYIQSNLPKPRVWLGYFIQCFAYAPSSTIFHLHLLSDVISDQYGFCRKIHWQGDLGLTACLHGWHFHAFHLRGEIRFQLLSPFSIN